METNNRNNKNEADKTQFNQESHEAVFRKSLEADQTENLNPKLPVKPKPTPRSPFYKLHWENRWFQFKYSEVLKLVQTAIQTTLEKGQVLSFSESELEKMELCSKICFERYRNKLLKNKLTKTKKQIKFFDLALKREQRCIFVGSKSKSFSRSMTLFSLQSKLKKEVSLAKDLEEQCKMDGIDPKIYNYYQKRKKGKIYPRDDEVISLPDQSELDQLVLLLRNDSALMEGIQVEYPTFTIKKCRMLKNDMKFYERRADLRRRAIFTLEDIFHREDWFQGMNLEDETSAIPKERIETVQDGLISLLRNIRNRKSLYLICHLYYQLEKIMDIVEIKNTKWLSPVQIHSREKLNPAEIQEKILKFFEGTRLKEKHIRVFVNSKFLIYIINKIIPKQLKICYRDITQNKNLKRRVGLVNVFSLLTELICSCPSPKFFEQKMPKYLEYFLKILEIKDFKETKLKTSFRKRVTLIIQQLLLLQTPESESQTRLRKSSLSNIFKVISTRIGQSQKTRNHRGFFNLLDQEVMALMVPRLMTLTSIKNTHDKNLRGFEEAFKAKFLLSFLKYFLLNSEICTKTAEESDSPRQLTEEGKLVMKWMLKAPLPFLASVLEAEETSSCLAELFMSKSYSETTNKS